jgi:4-hydroxy-3-methylbut-2-enyl diphosphate reductase
LLYSRAMTPLLRIELAHTQGFCAGVSNALGAVDLALEKYGAPLYVRHHIVHNNAVITEYEDKGVVFIETISEVPDGGVVIFSAHGIAPEVYQEAKARGLHYIDATCPLVTKVHREALQFSKKGIQTILIGHKGHQELIGTSGYVNEELRFVVENEDDIETLTIDSAQPVGYLTQTTLSVSDTTKLIARLKEKYPHIVGPPKSDICFATQNRQDAVTELAGHCDLIIVCGSPHSSNSNRLKETAEQLGVETYIIDTAAELELTWVSGKSHVGISSGASVPQHIVDAVVEKIQQAYPNSVVSRKESLEKNIRFSLPKI